MESPVKISEREYQKAIKTLFINPSRKWTTTSGRRLQILACGSLNPHEGPDFKDLGVLLDGSIIVGDGEFHKKASDWNLHNHGSDKNYANVILHIVIENDIEQTGNNYETLVVDKIELETALIEGKKQEKIAVGAIEIEELQHFALLRLLRKTASAKSAIMMYGFKFALVEIAREFLQSYFGKRTRHIYDEERLEKILSAMPYSEAMRYLEKIEAKTRESENANFFELLKKKIADEGAHLRREILLNCVLPEALALASEETRSQLFLWFWSTPALNAYGGLKRNFENFPQDFLWQQQGMLEYLKERGGKKNVCSETIREYGFAEILDFYKFGKIPNDEDFE